MNILIIVFIEQLHRFLFDRCFVQNRKPPQGWRIMDYLYNYLVRKHHNWRYELYQYTKGLERYSKYDRNEKDEQQL